MGWLEYIETFNPLVIDIEATGGGKCDEAVEICLVDFNSERVVFHEYINPTTHINYHALKVHGLTNKFLNKYKRFGQIEPKLTQMLDQRLLLGYDIRLDQRILNQSYSRYDKIPPITAWLCVLQMFKSIYQHKQLPSLTTACKIVNIQPGDHSAKQDALATLRLVQKLSEDYKNKC